MGLTSHTIQNVAYTLSTQQTMMSSHQDAIATALESQRTLSEVLLMMM